MRLDIHGHVIYAFHKHYTTTTGMKSSCQNGLHVIFMDFDETPLCQVEAICRMVQEHMDCGTFHILESSPRCYHAVCLDEFKHHEIVGMQALFGCDEGFMISGIKRKYWTLRTEKKLNKPAPKYVRSIPRASNKMKSAAHAKYLSLTHGLKLVGNDGGTIIGFDKYPARRN